MGSILCPFNNTIIITTRCSCQKTQGESADKLKVKAARTLFLVGLARSKQDPINRGHNYRLGYWLKPKCSDIPPAAEAAAAAAEEPSKKPPPLEVAAATAAAELPKRSKKPKSPKPSILRPPDLPPNIATMLAVHPGNRQVSASHSKE